MTMDPSRTGTEVWKHVDRNDPNDSGWWQLARLTRWDDGHWTLETTTRGSVVPTEIDLSWADVQRLRQAIGLAIDR